MRHSGVHSAVHSAVHEVRGYARETRPAQCMRCFDDTSSTGFSKFAEQKHTLVSELQHTCIMWTGTR
eukprot:scaffold169937_cov21-Tisochrysis_lutea.AAC.1